MASHDPDTPAVNYLKKYRLRWGQPDRLSLLQSSLPGLTAPKDATADGLADGELLDGELPPYATPYFTADTPPELISIIMNDWPYSGTPRLSSHHPP